ncbi:MAG TPA: DUF1501 domain-containing protein [Planctomycetaceae bacterium]|nr:DUF1501 domain-containing protein [Planctomycetaceae bacterium]
MLRILGSRRTLCDGLSRREMLRIGGLGGALTLADLWRRQAASGTGVASAAGERSQPAGAGATSASFGRAKRIILLYLYGAAAQHELYDPKPDAPAEIRGKFNPIATAVPGVQIGEHLPRLARLADRVTFIRSMTHPYNIHSAAYTLTGVDRVDIPMELDPYDNRHWPFFGSVLEYLARGRESFPFNVALPFLFSSRCPEFDRGGPYGGFLGRRFNPVWTEFEPEGSSVVKRWRGNADQEIRDPFAGISPDDRLTVSRDARLAPEITLDRLDRRRSLLEQLEDERRRLESTSRLPRGTAAIDSALASRSRPAGGTYDRFQEMAYSLITSQALRDALDLGRVPIEHRERYGMTLFGQSTLAGLRLLEAGATLVSVFWDEYGPANSAWDTHFDHYERLSQELLPGLDMALSALIVDLQERGMFDDTLILCLTEHGRTPKLTESARGTGREHWSDVYSNLVAGGGFARGRVVGASDRNGAFVEHDPVSPKDVLCTMYHLMGIDPHTMIPDRLGRPLPLVSEGRVLEQLLA